MTFSITNWHYEYLPYTVTEADGRVSTFTVPYASVAQLLRPGITRFDIAVGQLRSATISDKPDVVQGTLQQPRWSIYRFLPLRLVGRR